MRFLTAITVLMCFALASVSTESPASAQPDTLAQIRLYCAGVDRYAGKHKSDFIDFRRDRGPKDDGHGRWRRWPKARADEELDSNEAVRLWRRDGKVIYATFLIQSDSRDWALYVSNYYRPNGTIAKLESTLNTFYGDVTIERDWYYTDDGSLIDFKARSYRIATRQRVKLDDNFIDETVPLYRTVAALPFIHLLRKHAAPNKRMQRSARSGH